MEQSMKKIDTQGIMSIELLDGSSEWYWGMDYTSGDLYEAEELFKQGHPVNQNKLLFVHYPDGKVIQPIVAENGQYFGRPIYWNNQIIMLMVDFPAGKIMIQRFDKSLEQVRQLVEIPLSSVEDCYNLMLKASPLMLTRHGKNDTFQILWPEQIAFDIGNTETFLFRNGEGLYFSAWYEDPDYREETIVREMGTGEIVKRFPGSLWIMPDGQMWSLM